MSWQDKLNVNSYIINPEVDEYLKNHSFYESTMSPRFFGEHTHHKHIVVDDAPCLRLDTDDPRDSEYTMRIFINSKEVYMEVQTSYRSFDRSYHKTFDEPVAMYNIDTILETVSNM